MGNKKYLSGKINFNKFSNVFLNDKNNLNQSELKNLENTLKFGSKVTVYEMKNDLQNYGKVQTYPLTNF